MAAAQTTPSVTPADAVTTDTASQGQTDRDIVVTGSRVVTNGNSAPTPVTVVTTQQLTATTPTNIADGLNKLPQFSNSRSQQTLGNASSNAVGNFLNLRSFGIIRTLILFDGHRVPATASDGTVDVNTLPQQLMQRVDVVTGGASAVYGSDAVTGVVNFVLDKEFKGLRTFGQAGISGQGDDMTWRAGIVAGTDLFGGRGHIEGSFEHFNSDGIGDKFDRKSGRGLYTVQGAGTAASPFVVVSNSRLNNISLNGVIPPGPLPTPNRYAGSQIVNGLIVPFVHGTPTSTSTIESGGDGGYTSNSSLLASLRTDQAFGRVDYDITDAINVYAQGGYTVSSNANDFASFSFQQGAFPASNAFLPAATQGQLFGTGAFAFNFNRLIPTEQPFGIRARTENYSVTTGLTSKGGPLSWDIYYTHGQTKQRVINVGNVNVQRTIAASDAVRAPNGTIVCAASLTRPDLYGDCVPINAFGSFADAAGGAHYIRQDTEFTLQNKLDDVGASISASPFSTWAGAVQVALSGEYRSISLRNVSTAQPSTLVDCTGLGAGCASFLPLFGLNTTANAAASQDVKEGAVEINVPLLKDQRFFREVTVNGAARYTSYSTSGGATTWKVGVDWHVDDALRFRATRSRDIRAPTLSELFSPRQSSIFGFFDIHTNTGGLSQTVTVGNPALVPEKADTLTVGAVYKPNWLPGFSASVDYYKIDINNAISVITGGPATQARCEASNGTSPLCAQFIRPLAFSNRTAANFPTAVVSQTLNVAKARTYGIDGDIGYTFRLGGGRVDLRAIVSYQPVLEETQFADTVPVNRAGQAIGIPKWKASLFAAYDAGQFAFNVQERWRSALRQDPDPTLVYNLPRIASVAYTDVTVTFRPTKRFELFLSVNNLLDQDPPIYAGVNGASPNFAYPAYAGDDLVGRYFTSGARLRF
jgi:outer membrane receptor protein involved in Fe transport